jgi:peptidoglycan hydrolase-like protein with peptidoglycan-binding domain
VVSELTGREPDLALGDSGEGVVLLQVRLYWLGLYRQIPDGTFDMVTESAVRELQSSCGQDNTGEVTRATWEAIVYWERQYGIDYQYHSPYDALAQLTADRARADAYAADQYAADQYAADQYARAGQYSDDGRWWWDGYQWQAVGEQAAGHEYLGVLSDDGRWRWDGSQWQPV